MTYTSTHPFLANLLVAFTWGDAELAIMSWIEIIGGAETCMLGHVDHAEISVARQLIGHLYLKGHAEVDATHSRQHEHQRIDVLAANINII